MNNNAVRDGNSFSNSMRYAALTWRGESSLVTGVPFPAGASVATRTLSLMPSATSVAPSEIVHNHEKPDERTIKWGELCDRVLAFTKLSANWDGYNGKAPSILTVVRAILVLVRDCLAGLVQSGGIDLPCPFATHGGDGSIQFEWTVGRKHFEIVVPDDDNAPIFWLSSQNGPHGEEIWEGIVTEQHPDELVRWLKWLVTEK